MRKRHRGWVIGNLRFAIPLLCMLSPSQVICQGQTAYFPHFASGVSGTLAVRTIWILSNPSRSAATCILSFRNSAGDPLRVPISGSGESSTVTVTLAPDETKLIRTEEPERLVAGSVGISSSHRICMSMSMSFSLEGRLATETVVLPASLQSDFSLPADSGGPVATALALHNPHPEPAHIRLRLLDSDGREVASREDDLPGWGHSARYLTGPGQFFPSLISFRGCLVITSSQTVAALAMRHRLDPLTFVSLPLVPASHEQHEYILPHVANGQIEAGSYRTTMLLLNASDRRNHVTMVPRGDDGLPTSLGIPGFSFDAGAATLELTGARAARFLDTDGKGLLITGSVRVTSTEPLGIGAIMTALDRDGRPIAETAMLDAKALSEVVIAADSGPGADVGLALFNPGGETARINLYWTVASGTGAGAAPAIELPPDSHRAQFLSGWIPGFRGSPRALCLIASHPVAATAVSWKPETFCEIPVHEVEQRPALILSRGMLVDGTGGPVQNRGALAIRNGRILFSGNEEDLVVRTSDQRIDVSGKTILPGFFNTHVHNSFNETNLAAWARAGVTTVRDLGLDRKRWDNALAFRQRVAGVPGYARIIASGPMMTVAGGYPTVRWGIEGINVDSPADARQKAIQLLDQGADVIKIALEEGYCCGGKDWPVLPPDETAAIVNLAHERGTKVSAHVSDSVNLERAIESNVDDIAHMLVDDRLEGRLISKMVAAGIYWVPTMELWAGAGSWFAQNSLNNLRRFVSAGGLVALGTDYYGAPWPFELGMPLQEMRLMKEAGMSPMQIIMAATRNAARVSNCDRILGTLEPGKIADVLVIDGDPLVDIEALSRPYVVVRNGVVIRGSELLPAH